MTKNVFLFLMTVLLAACGSNTNKYNVKGEVEGAEDGSAVLQRIEVTGPVSVDTTEIVDGSFKFSGTIEHAQFYLISANDKKEPIAFFLENSDIDISANVDSLQDAEVTGSDINDKFVVFTEEVPLQERMPELQEEFQAASQAGDQEKIKLLKEEYKSVGETQEKYVRDFIFANNDNVLGAFLTMNVLGALEPSEVDELMAAFEENIPEHPYIDQIKDLRERMKQQQQMQQQMMQQQQQQQPQQPQQQPE